MKNKRYSNGEEWANTLSHGAGILLGVIAGYFLLVKATENADKNDARSFTGLQEIMNKPLKHCFVLSNDYQVKNFGENITAMHTAAFLG